MAWDSASVAVTKTHPKNQLPKMDFGASVRVVSTARGHLLLLWACGGTAHHSGQVRGQQPAQDLAAGVAETEKEEGQGREAPEVTAPVSLLPTAQPPEGPLTSQQGHSPTGEHAFSTPSAGATEDADFRTQVSMVHQAAIFLAQGAMEGVGVGRREDISSTSRTSV